MECPKCRKDVPENTYDCPYCGTKIKEAPEKKEKKLKKLFAKKDSGQKPKRRSIKKTQKISDRELDLPDTAAAKKDLADRLRTAAMAVCVLLIIIIIVILLVSLLSTDGEKYAESIAEKIGKDVSSAASDDEINLADGSKYFAVNSALSFDYVYESDKQIKAGGCTYPEWAVFVKVSEYNFITDVTYTDFSVIKKDMRGKKQSAAITLDSFSKGDKRSSVLKYIDIDPYSITYSQSGETVYTFKYYYERSDGDEQPMILRAAFNEDGKYLYYTSEPVFPQNM